MIYYVRKKFVLILINITIIFYDSVSNKFLNSIIQFSIDSNVIIKSDFLNRVNELMGKNNALL